MYMIKISPYIAVITILDRRAYYLWRWIRFRRYRCTGPLRLRDNKISINAPTSTGGVFLLMQSKQFIIHWRVEKQEENKDSASVIALDV
jgi:hypothetical protein